MATITDIATIYEMLTHNGVYADDPAPQRIYHYWCTQQRAWSHYAVFSRVEDDDMAISPFVKQYALLWTLDNGLTAAGYAWLRSYSLI